MENYILQEELKKRIELHKENILKYKITKYYDELQNTGILIPNFLLEKPENLAEQQVQHLKIFDRIEFERLYDIAWWEYAKEDEKC